MAARTDHRPGPDPSPPPTPGSSCTPVARGLQTKSSWVQRHLGPHPGPPWAPHKSTSTLLTNALAALGALGPCSCPPPGARCRTWGSKASGATGPLSPSHPTQEGVASTRMLTGLWSPPEVESSAARTRGHHLEQGWRAAQSPHPSSGACSHEAVVRPLGNRLHTEAPKTQSSPFLVSAASVPSERCWVLHADNDPQDSPARGPSTPISEVQTLRLGKCSSPTPVSSGWGHSCPGTQEGRSRRACCGDGTSEAGRGTPALPPRLPLPGSLCPGCPGCQCQLINHS